MKLSVTRRDSAPNLHHLAGPITMKILIFFFMFFGLHQGLGIDYEALGNESLNFFISFLACIKAWARL
jgi:hypothetical protein